MWCYKQVQVVYFSHDTCQSDHERNIRLLFTCWGPLRASHLLPLQHSYNWRLEQQQASVSATSTKQKKWRSLVKLWNHFTHTNVQKQSGETTLGVYKAHSEHLHSFILCSLQMVGDLSGPWPSERSSVLVTLSNSAMDFSHQVERQKTYLREEGKLLKPLAVLVYRQSHCGNCEFTALIKPT